MRLAVNGSTPLGENGRCIAMLTTFSASSTHSQPEVGQTRIFQPVDDTALEPLDAQGDPLRDSEGEPARLERVTPDLTLANSTADD